MPNKPSKTALKYLLCATQKCNTLDHEMYLGKQNEGPHAVNSTPGAIVERLRKCVKRTSRNITTITGLQAHI